jgi:hypothetical protein
MSLDNDLAADVSDELFWDPKVDNTAIAVSADDGKITLRSGACARSARPRRPHSVYSASPRSTTSCR